MPQIRAKMNGSERVYIFNCHGSAKFFAAQHQIDSSVMHSPQQKSHSRRNPGRFAPQQAFYSPPRRKLARRFEFSNERACQERHDPRSTRRV
jgi:hypothetical protein